MESKIEAGFDTSYMKEPNQLKAKLTPSKESCAICGELATGGGGQPRAKCENCARWACPGDSFGYCFVALPKDQTPLAKDKARTLCRTCVSTYISAPGKKKMLVSKLDKLSDAYDTIFSELNATEQAEYQNNRDAALRKAMDEE